MYLLIENHGVAPVEAFTLLGDSGTRHKGIDGLIGQFGSGTKHAINLLLRKKIEFHIYCGRTRLEFYVESCYVQDADGTKRESYPVKCRLSGDRNKTLDCGWTLEFGERDWTETHMALREFVSNAIDSSKIMGGEPIVQVEHNRRAKSGSTRVFISLRDKDVSAFHRDLGIYFLHFSNDPSQVDQEFLVKNHCVREPLVYREGVLVRKLESDVPAAFDYNFKAKKILIDECRNSSESNLRANIAQAINRADKDILAILFKKISEGKVYESSLDDWYLSFDTGEDTKKVWREAWKEFAGDAVMATPVLAASPLAEHIRAKGHKVASLPENFVKTGESMGIKGLTAALGGCVANSIDVEVTPEAEVAVAEVWDWCETFGMTHGKPKPKIGCYKQLMDGEGERLGFYKPGSDTVHIREDVAGKLAKKTALEEVAHYITGSGDYSRDIQQFAFDMVVEICS